MGGLRLGLALLVAVAHLSAIAPGIPATLSGNAVTAVRAFFVLSGFYMALALHERYANPWAFYASRALKLLPLYWIVSALTFAAAAAGPQAGLPFDPLRAWHQVDLATLPADTVAYVTASLITLVGADTWMWLGFDPVSGAWSVAPTYAPYATSALALAAVPQAWTLGLELQFYLLAPFLVRLRTGAIVALAAASLALRIWLAPEAPYDRALLPLELVFFLAGILLFRMAPALANRPGQAKRLDAELGALSYPVYLAQFLVFILLWRSPLAGLPWWALLPVAVAALIGTAVVLDRAIARPVDRLRVRFGARARPDQNSRRRGSRYPSVARNA